MRYIKGRKEKPSIHLIRGKAVHETIARFAESGREKGGKEGKDLLLQIFKGNWMKQRSDLEKLKISQETVDKFYLESVGMLDGWFKRTSETPFKKSRSEIKLFSKAHGVMGIIDAIQRQGSRVLLTDYKTSSKKEITDEIKVQLAVYALLYKENFGRPPDLVGIDFLKQQEERRFAVTPKLIDYAVRICREIHLKTSSREEKDYPCRCGGWCEKDFVKNG